jgi:hypothetical protein
MTEYTDPWHLKYCARIKGGQQFTGVHERIEEWIKTVPGSRFDGARGVSYINGTAYYQDLVFDTEEDLVAFKLAFAGLVT